MYLLGVGTLLPQFNFSWCEIFKPVILKNDHCISVYVQTLYDTDMINLLQILPQYRGKEQAGTLLYIPSYYDYVRLRNYLQKERIETSLVCEWVC